MSYLYGDSSPSPLESNFIDFLRMAMDFCVHVVLSDQRLLLGRERRAARERATALDLERLEALGDTVQRMVAAAPDGKDTPTARCAAVIARAAADAVRNETAAVRGVLTSAIAELDADGLREREGCLLALEKLLLKHDLPNTESSVHLAIEGGNRYSARLRGKTNFGLITLVQLEIPPDNLFAHDVRVDKLTEVEIHLPETGGWIRKETRMTPHKLGKLHIAEVTIDGAVTIIRLRAMPDTHSAGYDVTIRDAGTRVSIAKVGKDEPAGEPFDIEGPDEPRVLALYDKLAGPIADLTESRKSLVQAALDGQLMRDMARPVVLVERLVAVMAPIVREIAAHSLSPTELVLRRLIKADHREEIFVSKAELLKKIEALPEGERAIFESLGLHQRGTDDEPTQLHIKHITAEPAAVVTSGMVPAASGTIPPKAASRAATAPGDEDWVPVDEETSDTKVTRQPSDG